MLMNFWSNVGRKQLSNIYRLFNNASLIGQKETVHWLTKLSLSALSFCPVIKKEE